MDAVNHAGIVFVGYDTTTPYPRTKQHIQLAVTGAAKSVGFVKDLGESKAAGRRVTAASPRPTCRV